MPQRPSDSPKDDAIQIYTPAEMARITDHAGAVVLKARKLAAHELLREQEARAQSGAKPLAGALKELMLALGGVDGIAPQELERALGHTIPMLAQSHTAGTSLRHTIATENNRLPAHVINTYGIRDGKIVAVPAGIAGLSTYMTEAAGRIGQHLATPGKPRRISLPEDRDPATVSAFIRDDVLASHFEERKVDRSSHERAITEYLKRFAHIRELSVELTALTTGAQLRAVSEELAALEDIATILNEPDDGSTNGEDFDPNEVETGVIQAVERAQGAMASAIFNIQSLTLPAIAAVLDPRNVAALRKQHADELAALRRPIARGGRKPDPQAEEALVARLAVLDQYLRLNPQQIDLDKFAKRLK